MLDKRNKKGPKSDKPFRKPRKKVCALCVEKQDELDYKDVEKVKKFISDKGKILPRRVTGTCAKHQRKVVEAIQRTRHIALIPYSVQ
ncbi:MAG: 30S ribosomal protein S18 [Clostridia bacterium]|nr:30S ribosomal protein S18 [Clostridia bacterium]MDD4387181.1 30S ribosomal protein S18 [Clostridia bacterium]